SLPHLTANVLALVADALALVGLGRAHLADLSRDLADLLLVDALNGDLRRRGNLEGDALRRVDDDRVRVADVELERRPAQRRAVAHALDLELLLEALGHALDHVRDERAREAVERAVLAAVGRARHDELVLAALDRDPYRNLLRQLAERSVDHHATRIDCDADACRHGDWLSTDARHTSPDEGDHLAADAALGGGAVGDQPARGGQDRGAHTAEHARQAVLARIDAASGLRDALEIRDHA